MKPSVVMIAGPNGAGKTSAAMTLLPDFLHMQEFVNADEIARGLSPLNASSVTIEAGRLMLKRLSSLTEQRKPFAFETTGAGYGHVRTLAKCRDAGYGVSLIFLYLSSSSLAVRRVKLRVSQGGHDIPEADIIRRYHKGVKMFFTHYVPLADKVEVYDNSDGDIKLMTDDCVDDSQWKVYQSEPLPCLHDVLGPALHKVFLRAADLAKQTRTYLVVQKRGEPVREIPYYEIDDFVAKKGAYKDW